MKKIFLILFSLMLLGLNVYAQEIEINAQLRPRLILDNRDFNSNTAINTYTEMRTRLGVSISPLNNLNAFVQIQDSRVFGTEPGTLANTKNLDIHQAYFIVGDLFDLPVDLKVGRMEAAYGNQRIMGAVGWSNVGRSFDGITLKFDLCKVKLDLFAFREVETYNPGDSLDQDLYGGYAYVDFFEGHSLQPYVIYYTSSSNSYPFDTFTFGASLIGDIDGFHHEAEAAYQTGKQAGNGPVDVNAMLLAYNAGYTFDHEINPMIGAGVDYLSGDKDQTDNEYKVFNTLFATNHKFYGYMDYFINIPANTMGLGLTDIHVKAGFQPAENFGMNVTYHMFNSAEEYTFIDGTTSNSFGSEVDLILDYNYNSYVSFQGGASLFIPGKIFEQVKGEDVSTWFYLMAVVNL